MRFISRQLSRARYRMTAPYLQGNILELGCGLSEFVQKLSPSQGYVGIDSNQPLIEILRQEFPHREFHWANIEQGIIDLGNRQFDTLLLVAVFEHLVSPKTALAHLLPYLRDGGKVVLTTPTSFGHLVHRVGAYIRIFSREAADDHHSILDQHTLRHIFERLGLELVAYQPFQFGMNQLAVGVKKNLTLQQ